jgi:hypothetical protein
MHTKGNTYLFWWWRQRQWECADYHQVHYLSMTWICSFRTYQKVHREGHDNWCNEEIGECERYNKIVGDRLKTLFTINTNNHEDVSKDGSDWKNSQQEGPVDLLRFFMDEKVIQTWKRIIHRKRIKTCWCWFTSKRSWRPTEKTAAILMTSRGRVQSNGKVKDSLDIDSLHDSNNLTAV